LGRSPARLAAQAAHQAVVLVSRADRAADDGA
jgi:hypothetical protein